MINEKNFFSENKKINVSNTASLINLKAELFKKKQDAIKNKLINKKEDFERINTSKNISNSKWNQKAIKLDEKIRESIKNKREQLIKPIEDDELEKELKKSKENLLKKTKLYEEKLKKAYESLSNKDELKEDNEELIDFERKIIDASKYGLLKDNLIKDDEHLIEKDNEYLLDPEELIEYLDSFGRTRKCKRKELKKIQKLNEQDLLRRKLDRDLTKEDNSNNVNIKNDLYSNFIKSTSDNDEDNNEDQHYQEITRNEIREHGTSYYQFSLDEEKRRQEMEKLDELRKQTVAQRKQTIAQKNKADELMKQRLLKLAKRKGIVKEDDDDKKINLDQYIKNVTTNDDNEIEDLNYSIDKKEKKLREWDIDKNEFMNEKIFKDKNYDSNNRFNNKNKSNDESYFFIDKGPSSSNKYNADHLTIKDSSDDELSKFNPEFAPPSNLYDDNRRKKMKLNDKTAEEKADEFLQFTMNRFK